MSLKEFLKPTLIKLLITLLLLGPVYFIKTGTVSTMLDFYWYLFTPIIKVYADTMQSEVRALYISLQEVVLEHGIKAAVVLSGLGLLSKAKLRNCKSLPEDFPITDHNRDYTSFETPLEILGISGNVSTAEGKPLVHAHLTLSCIEDEKIRVVGGHMIEGSIVHGFSEIIIMELTDIRMLKEYDAETKTLQLLK